MRAASALLACGTRWAPGRCWESQAWHGASDCGCEYTLRIASNDAAQHLGLALGAVGAAVRLQLSDGGGVVCTLVQKRDDFFVERVDRGAVPGDVVGHAFRMSAGSGPRARP